MEKVDTKKVEALGETGEGLVLPTENIVKNEEDKIRKVRFAVTDTHIENHRILLVSNSLKNGSGDHQGVTPILSSILKSSKFSTPRNIEKRRDIHSADLSSKVQISSQFNKNLLIEEGQASTSTDKLKNRIIQETVLAKSKHSNEINSGTFPPSDDQQMKNMVKNDDAVVASTTTQNVHNTRRRSRKSVEIVRSLSPDIELHDYVVNNDEIPKQDATLTNGTSLKIGESSGRARGRGRGRGRVRGRGRGRGRGAGVSCNVGRTENSTDELAIANTSAEEDSLVIADAAIITDTSPKVDELAIAKESENNTVSGLAEANDKTVKCAKCSAEMPKNKWSMHNLNSHNNMAWRDGDPILDFENDQKLLTKVLVTAHKRKKGTLICEKCGNKKRSVVGFVSHIQFCGKTIAERDALLMTCPICHRTMMPSSLEVHHRVHRQQPLEPARLMAADNSSFKAVTPGSKRKAAERAITRISEFTTLVQEADGPPSKKSRPASPSIKKFIKKPQLKKSIAGIFKSIWRKQISTTGSAHCRQPGCTASFSLIDDIYEHYSLCNFTPRKNFSCKICKFTSENEADIEHHVTENHMSNVFSDDESNSEEYSDDEGDEFYNDGQTRKKSESTSHVFFHWKKKPKSWYKIEFLAKEEVVHVNKPYTPAIKWTLEFELRNYQLNLFLNLAPNIFELLESNEADSYLPELNVSMAMKTMHMKQLQNKVQSSPVEWKRWNRFEGAVEQGIPTFFVGGPVWAMAWLPIPTPMFSQNVDQYLAVSTHPEMESEYSLGRSYVGKNVIQIWNVGKLNNKGGSIDGVPNLAYAIAHTSGTIWCMEWCPSGCYQDKVPSNYSSKNEQQTVLKRMGLLATACSDGCVHIYSMPFPEELESLHLDHNRNRILKTDPVITLVVNTMIYNDGKQNWQCTKLNWTKERDHDTIVAGFSNGYIALWNITTTSPLLLKKQQNTMFINSVQHFFAHGHAVSAVSLVPYGGKRFLATAGFDRYYKFWDLENTSGPQSTWKRGLVVDGTWLTHWPTVVNSYDDVFGLNHSCTNFVALREYGYKICLGLSTNSPVYSVSASDYANAIAHGSLAGDVQTVFPHQLLIGIDADRSVAKKRHLSSFIKFVDLCESDTSINAKPANSNAQDLENSSADYKYMPSTYKESKDRFGIIFYDMPYEMKELVPTEIQRRTLQTDELSMVPLESYPFTSVNRVSWNPNAWSYLWLATGYQCGIIRISCFKSMYIPATVNSLLPKYVDSLFSNKKEKGS